MKRIYLGLTIAMALVGSFANAGSRCSVEERFDNVVRIFMERPTGYILMVRQPSGLISIQRTYTNSGPEYVHLFDDVPANQPMYVVKKNCGWSGGSVLEIHLHSVQEINGSGFTSGKTSGVTHVLE